jgi:hypothetical protein
MIETLVQANVGATAETVLRDELVHGDALVSTIAPILRHLLANDEHSVFSDEIIARVRGMMEHVANQLLDAQVEVAGNGDERNHPRAAIEALKDGFVAHPGFLAHVHALAMEWQLTERLHARLSLDPVLSPLLQALISSTEASVAANAMALLAAQARFAQALQRMHLPLTELPGDLLHAALLGLRSQAGEAEAAQLHAAEAERMIRTRYDESRSRLGLIARIVAGMGGAAGAALSVTHAGVAIFASALALASGQDRDMAVLATNEGQMARLALALRASGLKPEAVEEQFVSLHPDVALPDGFDQIGPDRAAALLAHSAVYPGS